MDEDIKRAIILRKYLIAGGFTNNIRRFLDNLENSPFKVAFWIGNKPQFAFQIVNTTTWQTANSRRPYNNPYQGEKI